jgi:hypothetical protein
MTDRKTEHGENCYCNACASERNKVESSGSQEPVKEDDPDELQKLLLVTMKKLWEAKKPIHPEVAKIVSKKLWEII